MKLLSNWKRQKIIEYLKNADPQEIMNEGEKRAIRAFQRAARKLPGYNDIIKRNGINCKSVTNIDTFKQLIPIIDKSIFNNTIEQLCIDGKINNLKSIMLSSGFSNRFSYGISSKKELDSLIEFSDMLLELNFKISRYSTFLINCLGMGVHVNTSLPIAETSVRSDIVVELVKKICNKYDQIVILGNTYFMKKVLEEGVEKGIDWGKICIHIVVGEDWFSENYRSYLARILGIDPDNMQKGAILSTLGICELGLSLFQESVDTVRIRRLADANPKLKSALFGKDIDVVPMLFHYNPFQIFLEECDGKLIFTTLNNDALMPLIRYSPGDKGIIIPYNKLKDILSNFSMNDYIPSLKLPLVAVKGREGKFIKIEKNIFTPEQVKTGIYSDADTARATTGYFVMSKDIDNGHLKIEIQLKEGREDIFAMQEKFRDVIKRYINTDNFNVVVYLYKDFPYGMALTYEEKFRNIAVDST